MQVFSVELGKIIKEFKLESVYVPDERALIYSADVYRPGLQIAGYFDHFDSKRIQVFGMAESTYLADMSPEKRYDTIKALFETKIPAVIVTRNATIHPEVLELSKIYELPLMRTPSATSTFMSALIAF